MNFLKSKIKLRGDTLENWNNSKIVLEKNEMCIVYCPNDIIKFKIGNGTDTFSDLVYVDEIQVTTQLLKVENIEQGTTSNSATNQSIAAGALINTTGSFSAAFGVQASTTHNYSFVWNGTAFDTLSDRYSSKGLGTFCINPVGGIEGFYIGDENLKNIIVDHTHDSIQNSDIKIDSNRNFYVLSTYNLTGINLPQTIDFNFIKTTCDDVTEQTRAVNESENETEELWSSVSNNTTQSRSNDENQTTTTNNIQNRWFKLQNGVSVISEHFGSIVFNNGDIIDNIHFKDQNVITNELICNYYHASTGITDTASDQYLRLNLIEESESESWKQVDKIAIESQTISNTQMDSFQDRIITLQTDNVKLDNIQSELYSNIVIHFSRLLYVKDSTALTRYKLYDLTLETDVIDCFQQLSTDFLLKIKVTDLDDVNTVITSLCNKFNVTLENIHLDAKNKTIQNVSDPVNDTDASNKRYVDNNLNGKIYTDVNGAHINFSSGYILNITTNGEITVITPQQNN